MKALSLFAGVGGFELACERADIQVVAHCEIDKSARSVLRRHFPDALSFDDVRTLTADDLRRADAVPDLICGGFPCQDLSVAGRRAGLAGARSGLFYEIARLAAELRPRWLVLENVPGILSSNDGRDMGAVLGTLGELGYGWAYRVLDAQHFGVPQRRRRVFIVGCLGDRAAPVEVLLEPEGSDGDPAPRSEARTGVATGAALSVALRGRDGGSAAELGDDLAFALRRPLALARRERGGDEVTGLGAHEYDMTPTLLTSQTIAVQTQLAVRRLTPMECERLQGFPDGWTAGQADSARYRQMGNAVAVPVVEWILRRLVAVSRATPMAHSLSDPQTEGEAVA